MDNSSDQILDAIKSELKQARGRAASLEQRAIAVVTISGVLVSLVFGFGTSIGGHGFSSLSAAARIFLLCALLSFVSAAVISLLAFRPRPYLVKSELEKLLTSPIESADNSRASIAKLRLSEINHWQDTNKPKANLLLSAITAECFGIILLAVSMLVVIL